MNFNFRKVLKKIPSPSPFFQVFFILILGFLSIGLFWLFSGESESLLQAQITESERIDESASKLLIEEDLPELESSTEPEPSLEPALNESTELEFTEESSTDPSSEIPENKPPPDQLIGEALLELEESTEPEAPLQEGLETDLPELEPEKTEVINPPPPTELSPEPSPEGDFDPYSAPIDLLEEEKIKKTLLNGKLRFETSSSKSLENAQLTLADVEIKGKKQGDLLSLEDTLVILTGLSTTEKDFQALVIEVAIKRGGQKMAQNLLEDQAKKELLQSQVKKKRFQSLEAKVVEIVDQKEVKGQLAQALKDDLEIEMFLATTFMPERKEEILKESVKAALKQEGALDIETLIFDTLEKEEDEWALVHMVEQKVAHDSTLQNILTEAVMQAENKAPLSPGPNPLTLSVQGPGGSFSLALDQIHFKAGSLIMKVNPSRQFTPGLYTLTMEFNNPLTGELHTLVQDLAWGVLAINADRDVYKPGEEAFIAIGVLDDQGYPLCDAVVELAITSPSGNPTLASVENTGQCTVFDSMNVIPDYQSFYTLSEPGEYQLQLTATLPNGSARTRQSSLRVEHFPSYIIERNAATRLYPVGHSEMTLTLYFNQDFEGEISETLPADFEILSTHQGGGDSLYEASLTQGKNEAERHIIWPVKAMAGELLTLSYHYDAPDVSPEFYTLGPLKSSGHLLEKRQWEIANDEPSLGADTQGDLLGHWKFNTGSGTTAFDSSPHENRGSLINMGARNWTTDTPTSRNLNPYSLSFDGVNQKVAVPYSAGGSLDFGDNDNFTITGWFNRSSSGSTDTILAKRNSFSLSHVGYMLYISSSGLLTFSASDGKNAFYRRSSSSFTAPGWNHFAAVWDQGSAANTKIYINGVNNTGASGGTIGNVGDLSNVLDVTLGSAGGGSPFGGNLDDLRIYNRPLSDEEIFTLASDSAPGGIFSDLQLWLKADQGVVHTGDKSSATAWADQSGHGIVLDHAAVSTTSPSFPTYKENLINGHPALIFASASDRLATNNFTGAPTQDMFISLVYQRDYYTGTDENLFSYSTPAHIDSILMEVESDGGLAAEVGELILNSPNVGAHDGNPHIATLRRSGSTLATVLDGVQAASGSNSVVLSTGGCLVLAEDQDSVCGGFSAVQAFKGNIAEMLIYNASLSLTDQIKISSYLALKYGITMKQLNAAGELRYLDSWGSVIWSPDPLGEYQFNVAGIGQDEASGLYQSDSKSSHAQGIVRMSEATNQNNLSFLTWANNNESNEWTPSDAPAGYHILERSWQAQKKGGDLGIVDLEIDSKNPFFHLPAPLAGTDYYFIYDSNDNGSFANETPILMKDDGTGGDDVAGDGKWTTQINFPSITDRINFVIATSSGTPESPGGVLSNLRLWLKADSGVTHAGDGTDATAWLASGPFAYLLSTLSTTYPRYVENLFNHYPGLNFSQGTGSLGLKDFGNIPLKEMLVSLVYQRDPYSFTSEGIFSYANTNHIDAILLRPESSGQVSSTIALGKLTSPAGLIDGADSMPHILTVYRDAVNAHRIYFDGRLVANNTTAALIASGGCLVLGQDQDSLCGGFNTSKAFKGGLAEMTLYNAPLTSLQRDQVHSYLALKYGITLDQSAVGGGMNYVDSASNIIWLADPLDVFEHGIAGLGTDSASGLDQAIGQTSQVEKSLRIFGASAQNDGDFMVWAHNKEKPQWTSTGAPAGYQLLKRQWKVQETGSMGSVKVEFDVESSRFRLPQPLAGSNYYLVYDSNGDGDLSDETPLLLYDDGSNGDEEAGDGKWTTSLTFPTLPIGEKVHFSLATQSALAPAPGAQIDDLQLWLKADAGVTHAGDGTEASAWKGSGPFDFIFNHSTSPAINGTFPLYKENLFNFNPGLNFSRGTDRLGRSDFWNVPVGDLFIIAVYKRENFSGSSEKIFSQSSLSVVDRIYMGLGSAGSLETRIAANTFLPTGNFGSNNGRPHIAVMRRNSGSHDIFLDATYLGVKANGTQIQSGGCFVIGARQGSVCGGFSTGEDFEGDLAELIIYDSFPQEADQKKVISYLALKYGITLNQSVVGDGIDYVNASGDIIWAKDSTDLFEHAIFGIGRDDASDLNQIQSKSIEPGAILTLSGATSQEDGDFLMVAHNNGAASWEGLGAPEGYQILDRKWQAQKTNDLGTVTLTFDMADLDFNVPDPINDGSYYFLYDSNNDGDLSDETALLMSDEGGGSWSTQVDFDGDLDPKIDFTLATQTSLPPTLSEVHISINSGSGTGGAFIVGDELIVTWNNSITGDNNVDLISITADLSAWGGPLEAVMSDGTNCGGLAADDIYEACYTLIPGNIDAVDVNTTLTLTTAGGTTITSDTSDATVDNEPPVVTLEHLSVTGASGTGGAFKEGDTPTGQWDNSALGDNNIDIASVTFDLSNFRSTDTALIGTAVSDLWTDGLTGALDDQGSLNNNVSITVSDDAGNLTQLMGNHNYTIDTLPPSIDSITSVADSTTASYYDATDDNSTEILFVSSDIGTGVSACKWDTIDTSYALMAHGCASATQCVSDLAGEGPKTVYLSCIDGAGNPTASNTQIDYIVDATGPFGTSIDPVSIRIIDAAAPSFMVDDGSDSGSGIDPDSRVLERSQATYANNTCGAFGDFTVLVYSGLYPNLSDATAAGSHCYQYRWSVSDSAGNTSVTDPSATIVRVPLNTLALIGGNEQIYGDAENNPIGHTLLIPLQAQVTDGGTNTALLDEVTVNFQISSIPLNPSAIGQSLSSLSEATDAQGQTQVSLTLGDRAGDYWVEASSFDAELEGVTLTFTATAGPYSNVNIIEDSVSLLLDPASAPTDFISPTLSVTTNAASYELYMTLSQWPLSGFDQLLNWVNPLGFGWNLNLGTVMAFLENFGEPAATVVYSCSGENCQGLQDILIDLHAGIDFITPPGTYTTEINFSAENIYY